MDIIHSNEKSPKDSPPKLPEKAKSLGNIANNCATPERRSLQDDSQNKYDPSTGEILTGINAGHDSRQTRLERFALQTAAKRLLPKSRTAKCIRFMIGKQANIHRSIKHKTAQYSNLETCSSVWACPICAAKISERRRVELLGIMDAHKTQGGDCLLLTLTFPHQRGDDLPHLLKAMSKAFRSITINRSGRKLFSDMGIVGTVKALEVTHGVNGWHPHYHVLLFCAPDLDVFLFRSRFYALWLAACVKAGLGAPDFKHGTRLDGGELASKYVTKGVWGLEHELTKGHIKKAKDSNGRSPFDLLRSYLLDDDKQAGALFIAYALAFHGKKQLQYSYGLKSLYGAVELTDEEISATLEDDAELLGSIDFDAWRLILRHELRGEVLELARYGIEPVNTLIQQLQKVKK